MRLLASLFAIIVLLVVPWPALAAPVPVPSGLEISVNPPQASADALLKLPDVYAMPGSWWYWLHHIWEEFQLAITSDPSKRTELLLRFSQERLAEGYKAVKSGQLNQAVSALSDYQNKQTDLAASLDKMQTQNVNVTPFLVRLQQQLQIQQSLQQFTQSQKGSGSDKISQLLQIQPIQTLAFNVANERALLGVSTHRKSPVASVSATPSATPAPSTTAAGGTK